MMACSEVKGEVGSARDRLSGALSLAVDKFGGEDVSVHGIFGSPSKRLQSSESALRSPAKSPRQVRRRRKREGFVDSAFHHTFVMKLFGRSLDLAQFQKGLSLYPVCRAWMKNQPHNTNMAPRQRSPTPDPIEESVVPEESSSKTEEGSNDMVRMENGDEDNYDADQHELREPQKKAESFIYKLPPHELLPDERRTLRIPEPMNVVSDLDGLDLLVQNPDGDTSNTLPQQVSSEDLLRGHMVRWSEVRKRWRCAAANNEARFKDSMNTLQDMFEK